MQKPGLTGVSAAFAAATAAAAAAAAARLPVSVFTSPKAFAKFAVASGTLYGANFKLENVFESVIGFECQMKARPFPEGDCPCCASPRVSCVHLILGSIAFGITGLQVK